jgi:hypothetical protein
MKKYGSNALIMKNKELPTKLLFAGKRIVHLKKNHI